MENLTNSTSSNSLQPTLVNHRYRITKLLASTDNCLTCLCEDLHHKDYIKTIKLYKPNSDVSETEARLLFERLSSVTSKYLVPIVDYGKCGDNVYVVSNCTQLSPLTSDHFFGRIDNHESNEEFVIQLIEQSLKVLIAAHQNNVIACNIKIENFFLSETGEIIINDLVSLNRNKNVSSTLIPYEFQSANQFSDAVDYFNLALVFYQLLTDIDLEKKFNQKTYKTEYVSGLVPKISNVNPLISEWVDELIMAMLHPNPSQRVSNPDNVARFLSERASINQLRNIKNCETALHISEINKIFFAAQEIPEISLPLKSKKGSKLKKLVTRGRKWISS